MPSYTLSYRLARGPNKRKDKRLPLPVFTVKIDGESYSTINWSLGGLLVSNYVGNAFVDQEVMIDVKAKDDADFNLQIAAHVVRHDAERQELALQFDEMTPQIYKFFEQCFSKRFRR